MNSVRVIQIPFLILVIVFFGSQCKGKYPENPDELKSSKTFLELNSLSQKESSTTGRDRSTLRMNIASLYASTGDETGFCNKSYEALVDYPANIEAISAYSSCLNRRKLTESYEELQEICSIIARASGRAVKDCTRDSFAPRGKWIAAVDTLTSELLDTISSSDNELPDAQGNGILLNNIKEGEVQITGYTVYRNGIPAGSGHIAFHSPNVKSAAHEHLINAVKQIPEGDVELQSEYLSGLITGCTDFPLSIRGEKVKFFPSRPGDCNFKGMTAGGTINFAQKSIVTIPYADELTDVESLISSGKKSEAKKKLEILIKNALPSETGALASLKYAMLLSESDSELELARSSYEKASGTTISADLHSEALVGHAKTWKKSEPEKYKNELLDVSKYFPGTSAAGIAKQFLNAR